MSSRRRFLGAAGVTMAAGAVGVSCSSTSNADVDAATAPAPTYAFRGEHQAGVTAPAAPNGVVVGLDVRAQSREELAVTLQDISAEIEHVMSGEPYEPRDGGFSPDDTGILGLDPSGNGISVVVGFGDSLFDGRFGLADQKPNELQTMPVFSNDILINSDTSHGDLSLTINGATQDAVEHALRQVLRAGRGDLIPRWSKEGYNSLLSNSGEGEAPVRNLMGFKDGTSNPSADDQALMDDVVWVSTEDQQPLWALGGTYQALRIIRMQVEFWDRTRLNEQEAIFGRVRDTGAPLGGVNETDDPSEYDFDLTSHIGRANPRTSDVKQILRRGFSYSSGFDANSQLDQGLVFVSYQRSLEDGFIATQRRLDGEVLEEYIRPIHGGLFFVPPPPAEGQYLGQALIET